MLLVDDLAAGGTKNLRHTPRGLVTLGTAVLVDRLNRSYYHGSGHSSGMFVAVKGAVPLRRFLVRLLGTDIYWLA